MKSLTAIAETPTFCHDAFTLHCLTPAGQQGGSDRTGSKARSLPGLPKLYPTPGAPMQTPRTCTPWVTSWLGWPGAGEQGHSLPGAKTDGLCPVFLLEKLLPIQLLLPEFWGSPALALPLPHSQPSFEHQPISVRCCELLHFCFAKPAGGWVTQGMNSQITYSANILTKKKKAIKQK